MDETKNSIFNLLMNATNSMHGLSLEDRSFYYDPTFDKFEPIYRDGDPRIVDQNLFNKKENPLNPSTFYYEIENK